MAARAILTTGALLVVLLAVTVHFQFDDRVPPLPEQLKVKVIDFGMRMHGQVMKTLVSLGMTTHLSPFDRDLGNKLINLQVSGWPWQRYSGPELKVTDTEYDGVPVRVYEPTNTLSDKARPAVIYIHGGVWSLLSVETHDAFTSQLAIRANVVVISVSYRLSPDFPYPAGLDDVAKVFNYVTSRATQLHVNPSRVAVGGESCGGNMAAALSLRRMPHRMAMQILLVPVLQVLTLTTPSWIENADVMSKSINNKGVVALALAYGSLPVNLWTQLLNDEHTSPDFRSSRHYGYVDTNLWLDPAVVRSPELKRRSFHDKPRNRTLYKMVKDRFHDPEFMPLMADDAKLRLVPHAYVMTAGYDLIRDDGAMFAARLKSLGVKVQYKNYPNAFHHALMFHQGPLRLQVAVDILNDLAAYVKKHL